MKQENKAIALLFAKTFFERYDQKEARRMSKAYYKKNIDKYAKADPLTEDVRIVYDKDCNGEGWTEIWNCGECDPEDTNEEIRKWFWEEFATRIYSPYDCTGQAFTAGVSVVRTSPTTFIILNRMELDI